MTGHVRYSVSGNVAHVLFDRPDVRNAMTFDMYRQLEDACAAIRNDPSVRVAVFRGAGGEAFVAGTDIQQFLAFETPQDGVAYEERIDAVIHAVETLPIPTIAVVEGFAMGGGFALAIACDLRLATPDAKFGYPIARTVGNCLSMANIARLTWNFGPSLAKRVMLLADIIDAETALDVNFLLELVDRENLEARVAGLCERIAGHAPITMRVTKEAIRRVALADVPQGQDLIETTYGSADFRIGVESFLAKKRPAWTGR